LTVDGFEILVAQRYSVVVEANQPVGNYWISAPMTMQHSSDNDNCKSLCDYFTIYPFSFEFSPSVDTENVFAVLHYIGAPDADPTGKPKAFGAVTTAAGPTTDVAAKGGLKLLDESDLHPLVNPEAPGGSGPADRVIDLDFHHDTDTGEVEVSDFHSTAFVVVQPVSNLQWTINGIKYESPDLPTLLNIMVNNFTNENQFTTSEHTFVLKRDDIVEVQIHGSADGHKQ